jgi:hypothetical protein
MRYSEEQKQFAKGAIANYLDTKNAKPHTSVDMGAWIRTAWYKKNNEKVRFSPSLVVSLINELRDEGYLITRDPRNKGYRCVCGKRNATPDMNLIIDSQKHEKGRLATSVENNVVKPMITIQERVIGNIPNISDALRLVNELRKSDNPLDDAIKQLKGLSGSEYRLVPSRLIEQTSEQC